MNKILGALKEKKSRVVVSEIVALFFALTFVLGYQLQNDGFTMKGLSGKLIILLISLAISLVIFPVSFFLFYRLDNLKEIEVKKPSAKKTWLMFFIVAAVIFVAWVPVFLAYYPCIMSSDFDIQLYQITQGHEFFTNHHPFLSTLEIEFFYKLGPLLGSVRKGMAALGLFHMAAMSASFSYMIVTAYKLINKKWIMVLLTAVTIIYPINPLMTLSTTKDTLFSAFFMLLLCLLINRHFFENSKGLNIAYDCLIVVDGVLMCSYRNNAMYAIAVGGMIVAGVAFVTPHPSLRDTFPSRGRQGGESLCDTFPSRGRQEGESALRTTFPSRGRQGGESLATPYSQREDEQVTS